MKNENWLRTILRRNNLLEEYRTQKAVIVWDQIAGELTKIGTAKAVQQDKLIVEVDSAAAKQELNFLEEELLAKINQRLQEAELEGIKFVISSDPNRYTNQSHPDYTLEEVELSQDEREQLQDLLRGLDLDSDLRSQLERLMVAQKKLEKARMSHGWKKCPKCGGLYEGKVCLHCESYPS